MAYRIFVLLILLQCTTAQAQLVYEFLEGVPAKTVVATLTLEELPGDLEDFVALSFTARGQELLGFGETYSGVFDRLDFGQFISDGGFIDTDGQRIDGLQGSGESQLAVLIDLDPPSSLVPDFVTTDFFEISGSHTIRPSFDLLTLRYFDIDQQSQRFDVVGTWNLVPEPSFSWIHHLIIVGCVSLRWRRRRVDTKTEICLEGISKHHLAS